MGLEKNLYRPLSDPHFKKFVKKNFLFDNRRLIIWLENSNYSATESQNHRGLLNCGIVESPITTEQYSNVTLFLCISVPLWLYKM